MQDKKKLSECQFHDKTHTVSGFRVLLIFPSPLEQTLWVCKVHNEGKWGLYDIEDPRKWLSSESESLCRSLSKQQENGPHRDTNVNKTVLMESCWVTCFYTSIRCSGESPRLTHQMLSNYENKGMQGIFRFITDREGSEGKSGSNRLQK